MAAFSGGLADVIYNEVCDFSHLGGECGLSQHYTSSITTSFIISECFKDTTTHLRRLNSTENSCDGEFPEGLLILFRSGIFSVNVTSTSLIICPKHRDFYGIYWHKSRAKCQYPDHPSSSKARADRGSSPLLCKQNWLYTRQVLPVIIQFSNFVADHHGRIAQPRKDIDVEHENVGAENDTETVKNEIELGEDVNDDGLFACPEESCTKVYTKSHFLETHIIKGKHVYSSNENSYDSVKLIWAQQCEAVDRDHKVLIQSVSSIDMQVNEGWALKLNKPFKRFTKKVKDFLYDVYLKCESSGKRPNFDKLATELKTTRHENDGTKMFTREEWLSPSQIRSLFANFVKQGAATSLKSDETVEVIENILEEIESLEFHDNMTELATDIVLQFQ